MAGVGSYKSRRGAATIIIDCVDNPEARRAIHEVELGRHCWLISCGNAASNGHVMIGNCKEPEEHNLDAFGFCQYLPSPYLLEPELLKARPDSVRQTDSVHPMDGARRMKKEPSLADLSCAELTAIGLQERMVNVHAAAHAAVMVDAFLKGSITYFDVRFNIAPPTVKRKDITAANLGAWLGKAVKQGGKSND